MPLPSPDAPETLPLELGDGLVDGDPAAGVIPTLFAMNAAHQLEPLLGEIGHHEDSARPHHPGHVTQDGRRFVEVMQHRHHGGAAESACREGQPGRVPPHEVDAVPNPGLSGQEADRVLERIEPPRLRHRAAGPERPDDRDRLLVAAEVAIVLAIVLLFITGFIMGKLSEKNPWWKGLRMSLVGLAAFVVCYLIGGAV